MGIGERWVAIGVGINPSEVSKVHSVVGGQWTGGRRLGFLEREIGVWVS